MEGGAPTEGAIDSYDPFAGPVIESTFASTRSQLEIWAATQIGGDVALAYNEAVLLHLAGPVDAEILRQALAALLDRHEALRGTFSRDGRTMVVAAPSPREIPLHDVATLPTEEQGRRLAALQAEAVSLPFDLELGPLARCAIVKLGPASHEVLLAAHHMVCDGWSFGVLATELGTLYAAMAAGRPDPLAALGAAQPFSRYAQKSETVAPESLRWWEQQFATIPDPLDLPSDRPRPSLKTYAASREDARLPADLTAAVRAMGAKQGVSLFATLFAGFSALVSRLAGRDDLVVAVPAAGQLASGLSGVVGHCVNTLPLRMRVPGDQGFDRLLAAARTVVLDGFERQDVGYGQLVERLAIPRDPARLPLASVIFNLDRALSPAELTFGGVTLRMRSVPRCAENFDLFLNATEDEEGVALECQYNTDLFDAATIRRWLASYERLLRAAVAAPATPVARLALRTAEDERILAGCNDTARDYPAGELVHHMVAAQAARTPDAIAIEQGSHVLTYAQLDARTNRLARVLRAQGVRRGTCVGIYLERTPDAIVAIVAALKAGAGYVPLEPSLPLDRLTLMTNDAALTAIVTSEKLRADAERMHGALVVLDAAADVLSGVSGDALPPDESAATPTDPGYVLFTSGSTGRPKGVVVPQGALANLIRSVQERPGLTAADTVLAVTTLSFDIATSEVLLPLTVGARIVLASRETAMDGTLLRELVESRGVTFIDATPATYRLLLAAGWTGGQHLRLICTGEALPRELATVLLPCARELWNGYGPTETTVWSTFYRVPSTKGAILIGTPVANTVIDIRDTAGETVPVGVTGELYIGGAGVATGYLGNPSLTSERFQDDPARAGLRWYRTGDLVRLLPNGELECLGRADDQVKIRGFRIEPGEIAAVASTWPGVRQAVVVARSDEGRDPRLVAYVVADAGTELGDTFRAHLKRSLPDYMLPSAVVTLDAFPLTTSGKVDKKRLPAPDASAQPRTTFTPPRTETERLLASLWEKALGIGQVGVDDDFFALGGHSLMASQILARLRRDHGIELTFRRIFESPTIEELARVIDAEHADGTAAAVRPAIVARPGVTTATLSAQQERLWMLEELEPERRFAHSHPASWELAGTLDVPALERAFASLFRRHTMLRTSFVRDGATRRQVVHDSVPFTLGALDVSGLPPAEQDARVHAMWESEQRRPFDLEQAPLFRATLIRYAEDRHRIFTLQHGMIWDGWSFDLFLRDLGECYAAELAGREPALPALGITFGDFAEWQKGWMASDAAATHRAWWDARLAGAMEPAELPTDRSRPRTSSYLGGQRSISLGADDVTALTQLSQRYDATLFMVALSAFAVLLHRYSGQREILVATPMRARTQVEIEDVLGPFVNGVVLRNTVTPESTFAEVLRATRELALDSYAHQELPFESLTGRLPAIRAVFSMQDARSRPANFGPLPVHQVHVPLRFAANDVTLWMVQFPDRLATVLNYSTDLFDDASAERFLAQLHVLLQQAAQAPEQSVAQFGLRTRFDAPAAALDGGDARASSGTTTFATLDAIAASGTDRVALRHGRQAVTHGALWQRVGSVAAALRARGVGEGAVVAIELRSGVERVIAMLGALRAGGRPLIVSLDESASRQGRVRSAAGVVLRVVATAGGDAAGSVRFATLENEGASLPPVASDVAGGALSVVEEGRDPGTGVAATVHAIPVSRLLAQGDAVRGALALEASHRVLCAVPSAAPSWTPCVLAAVLAGATLQLMDEEGIADALDLSDAAEGCTHLIGVAEAWHATLDARWSGERWDGGMVVAGGLSREDEGRLARLTPRFSVSGGASGDATLSWIRRYGEGATVRSAPPEIAGTQLRIVDARGEEVAAGLPGDIEFARAGIDGAWQRTTIRARRGVASELHVLEGGDAPVVVYGHPVAPVALDRALRTLPNVSDAAVALHRDREGRAWLVAHVVTDDGRAIDATGWRDRLQDEFALAWIPTRFVAAREIPRRADGSVLRHLLPSPFDAASEGGGGGVPTTEEETIVCSVWQALLQRPHVGPRDSFFALGGTSLLTFRAIDLLQERTRVRVSPRTILLGTAADVAAELAAARKATT